MLALRYVALLAIGLWVGGLVALGGLSAPATFAVLGAMPGADGRVLAGAVFGETLRRFHLVAYGCGLILLFSLVMRAILGPRPRRFSLRLAIAFVMLVASLYSGIIITGQIADLRTSTGVAPSSLPASDPRRVEFGRLHGLSTGIQLVPLLGGLLLLYWEMRDGDSKDRHVS